MKDLFGNDNNSHQEKEELPKKKQTMFDMLTDLTYQKKNIMKGVNNDIPIFVLLNGLSQNIDTIMYASEMNKRYDIPPEIQYDYLLHSIPKRKRFSKWAKKIDNENINNISEFFQYSYDKSLQVEGVLTKEQLNIIKNKLNKGGLNNEK